MVYLPAKANYNLYIYMTRTACALILYTPADCEVCFPHLVSQPVNLFTLCVTNRQRTRPKELKKGACTASISTKQDNRTTALTLRFVLQNITAWYQGGQLRSKVGT